MHIMHIIMYVLFTKHKSATCSGIHQVVKPSAPSILGHFHHPKESPFPFPVALCGMMISVNKGIHRYRP